MKLPLLAFLIVAPLAQTFAAPAPPAPSVYTNTWTNYYNQTSYNTTTSTSLANTGDGGEHILSGFTIPKGWELIGAPTPVSNNNLLYHVFYFQDQKKNIYMISCSWDGSFYSQIIRQN